MRLCPTLAVLCPSLVLGIVSASAAEPAVEVEDIVITFAAADQTPLEAKLSIPKGTTKPVPVVFHLHGAGPRNFDHALRYMDADGQRRTIRYYDFFAQELARRGVAFFRMSKRGCTSEQPSGRPRVDRAVFSKATPSVLLDDYALALDALRKREEIDRSRIVLSGASEGTRLAPELALRSPEGIVGLALCGYAADNQHDIVVWQNTVGPWRSIRSRIPAADDGAITKQEHDEAIAQDATIATTLPFAQLDSDADGTATEAELQAIVKPRLEAILKAVEERNDELIWQGVANLSSAYLLEGWDGPPNFSTLPKIKVPVAIFHGELDAACRVEGVREAEAALKAAGKTNVAVHIYPRLDHDLNWTTKSAASGGSAAIQDALDFMAGLVVKKEKSGN